MLAIVMACYKTILENGSDNSQLYEVGRVLYALALNYTTAQDVHKQAVLNAG
jgi:hypothetical protein